MPRFFHRAVQRRPYLDFRTVVSDFSSMTGAEFVRRLRRLGRREGISVRVLSGQGKGSHGRLFYGARSTTIPDLKHELAPGLLQALCRQLEVNARELLRR